MVSTARLERLNKLVQADLEALPARPASPAPEPASDDDISGGVSLDPGGSTPPQPAGAIFPPDKQTATDTPAQPPSDWPTKSAPPSEENPDRRFVWAQGAASSYNLGSVPKLSTLPTYPLPPSNLNRGDLAPTQEQFTPILALAKYPYKFCDKYLLQDIASFAFDSGKFWARQWDLYYVWGINDTKGLILVTEKQFEDLLAEINSALKLQLEITNLQRESGLVNRFPNHPRTRPRYLGRSHSKEEYDDMSSNIPPATFRATGEPIPSQLDGRTLDDFKQLMEAMWEAQSKKNKAAKEKKKQERLARQQVISDEFKRTQRYLGLRPTTLDASKPGLPPAVDTSLPAPFRFDRDTVFLCVDVEAFERNRDKITEVGIATLDTRDLDDVPPGKDGQTWRSKIRARHFRIEENKHLVNKDFVDGCPDRFEFGKSEFVSQDHAAESVASCFKPPFCALPRAEDAGAYVTMDTINSNESRNIVFLGHDTLADVRYLQQLGFNPLDLPNLLECVDTANLYRVWKRDQNPTRLGNILYDFDITGWNLHNAGNDAVYTVQAMLGICVREAAIRGTAELTAKREEEKTARLTAAQQEAVQKAMDNTEGWSDNEAEGDGGSPVPTIMKETPKPGPTPNTGQSMAQGRPRVRTHEVVSFDLSSPQANNHRGRGRGRGNGPVDSTHSAYGQTGVPRYQSSNTSSTSERSGFRHPGHPNGRGQPRGHHQGGNTRGHFRNGTHRGHGRGHERGGGRPRARGPSFHSEGRSHEDRSTNNTNNPEFQWDGQKLSGTLIDLKDDLW